MPEFNQITAGTFCRELVCGIEPFEDLLESWGLTEEQYRALRQNKWFQKEIIAAVQEVKDLGPNSAFIMRCRAVADETLPQILNIIQNDRVDPKVRIDAYKQITDLGRLSPPKDTGSHASGPSVTFNFGAGLEGIPSSLTITPLKDITPPEPACLSPKTESGITPQLQP